MKKNKLLSLLILGGLCLPLASCGTSSDSSCGGTVCANEVEINKSEDEQGEVLFKIYYARPDKNTSYTNIWFWSSDDVNPGAGMTIFSTETVTFPQTGDFEWQCATLKVGQQVEVYSQWGLPNGEKRTIELTEAQFTGGLIITTVDGTGQTGELIIDFEQLANSSTKEIFFIDKGQKVGGGFFYDINAIPSYSVTRTYFNINGFGYPCLDFETKNELDFTSSDISIVKYRTVNGTKMTSAQPVRLSGNIRRLAYKKYRVDIIDRDVIDATWKYELHVKEKGSESVYDIDMQTYYSSDMFEENYTPDADLKLGSFIRTNEETGEEETVFRVWTPFSSKTRVVYKTEGSSSFKYQAMESIGKGVYEYVAKGNLGGTQYHYEVTNFGKFTVHANDPYAESVTTNAAESVVIDWNSEKVDPSYNNEEITAEFGSWDDVTPSEVKQNKASVTELHIRDFSSDESWTGREENVGKYMALTETGLTLADDSSVKIGYDYLKELADAGLTHVQLLPIYDFASVDETKLNDKETINKPSKGIFNWGYDPESYNSPEGSYSSDPSDPYARIRELRSVVLALDSADLGVVMDVVYNHMPSKNATSFNQLVPDYYFRTQDVSGAGASMISTRKMFRKFMVDSTSMWAENYKLSGFRFDLMGILDARTMMDCAGAVRDINENALMYGEGWQMYQSTGDQGPDEMMASQKNLQYFGSEKYSGTGKVEEGQFVGAFNDNYRDSLNGGTGNIDQWGFMQRAYNSQYTEQSTERNKVYYGLLGTNPYAYSEYYNSNNAGFDSYLYSNLFTGASVNYTECHDNLTAFDKLYATIQDKNIAYDLSALGNLINSMGIGVSFWQFGQEFGRSKEVTDPAYLEDQVVRKSLYEAEINGETHYFSHNSYNPGDKVNGIQWDLVKTNADMVTTFKQALAARELIAPVDTWADLESVYTNPSDWYGNTADYNVINMMIKATDGSTLYYYINPTQNAKTINVPYGAESTVKVIGGDGVGTTLSGRIFTVNPTSYVIMQGK